MLTERQPRFNTLSAFQAFGSTHSNCCCTEKAAMQCWAPFPSSLSLEPLLKCYFAINFSHCADVWRRFFIFWWLKSNCLKTFLGFQNRFGYSLKALLLNYRCLLQSYSCPLPSHTYKSLVNLISTCWVLHLFCLSRGPTMQLPVTRTHRAQI